VIAMICVNKFGMIKMVDEYGNLSNEQLEETIELSDNRLLEDTFDR
jgi:hypothetical protein